MIKRTKKFYKVMKQLYDGTKVQTNLNESFEEIMENNSSRLQFLNEMFDNINKNLISQELVQIFDESLEFIKSFINGEDTKTIEIPEKYYRDMNACTLVPTTSDMQLLFSSIDSIKKLYDLFYNSKEYDITLPKNTFNQYMTKTISIEKRNLAHLLGLTEHEDKENYLKKFFIESDQEIHPEYYDENGEYQYSEHISSRMIDWITSKEGQEQLLKISELTRLFIEHDKKEHPDSYESDYIKPDSIKKFKERYKEKTGFDYPIIKFSRYIVKSINLLNFMNMSGICEIISDYNAEIGEKNEKDLFLVNVNQKDLSHGTMMYHYYFETYINRLRRYAISEENEKKKYLLNFLKENGIDIEKILEKEEKRYKEHKKRDETSDDLEKDSLTRYLNLVLSYEYTEKHGIKPENSNVLEIVRNSIATLFKRNISLLGFGTEYGTELINLDESSVKKSHCDTSISIKIPDLIGKYYKRGRVFFLDKIGIGENILRISNATEELSFLEKMKYMIPSYSIEYESLKKYKDLFDEQYNNYSFKDSYKSKK